MNGLRYFSDLNFLWDQHTYGPTLSQKRAAYAAGSYLLLSLGLFARQITAFPKVDINCANIRWPVLLASFIIGLALFPPIMRFFNKKNKKPGFEHVVLAFGIGFFVDLASGKVIAPAWHAISALFK
jgi:hypothetical protein